VVDDTIFVSTWLIALVVASPAPEVR